MKTSDLISEPGAPDAPSASTVDTLKEEVFSAFKKAGYKGMIVMLSPAGGIHPMSLGLNYLELIGVSRVCSDNWLSEMSKKNSGQS